MARLLASGGITPGESAAVAIYVGLFMASARALTAQAQSWPAAAAALTRLRELGAQAGSSYARDGTSNRKKSASQESKVLALANIHFRYGRGPWLLSNLTLRCEPGKIYGITGPSGAGKTTLAKLLLGLEQPESGSISFANSPLGNHSRRALASLIRFVPQDIHLTEGSIKDNITFADTLLANVSET
jgi:ABC-type bacteriocin/lantibiotic exporter with double-glycine peptidase domain